jgi:hypothetical protein
VPFGDGNTVVSHSSKVPALLEFVFVFRKSKPLRKYETINKSTESDFEM